MLFTKIEGENAILISNGVYRQCDLYERNNDLYAKVPGGFVRLYANGSTSQPQVRLETLAYLGPLYMDRLGRLTLRKEEQSVAVDNMGTLQIGTSS